MIPAFMTWTASPDRGISTTTVVCARFAISTSLCPAPTVSTKTMSMPSASRTRTASKVARAKPPGCPRVAIDRMNTPGSIPVSAIRIRSPSTAPPVNGEVGSTATTPTFFPRLRYARTSRLIRELFPTPGGPVNPTMCAFPVLGWIRSRASAASGSSSSIREMSFAAARLSPRARSWTSSATRLSARPRRRGRRRRAATSSRTLRGLLEEPADLREGRPRAEDGLHPGFPQLRHVLLGDDPSARDDDVLRPALPEDPHDLREQGHVRAAQAGQADRVDVLLDRGLGDVLRGLAESGVDDLHPRVAERPRDHLRATVMPVEPGFRDQDADLLRHHIDLSRAGAPPTRRTPRASRRRSPRAWPSPARHR